MWVHWTGSVQVGWGCPTGNGQSVWVRQIGSDPPPEAPSPAPGNASSPAPAWLSASPPPLWMNLDPGNKWECYSASLGRHWRTLGYGIHLQPKCVVQIPSLAAGSWCCSTLGADPSALGNLD